MSEIIINVVLFFLGLVAFATGAEAIRLGLDPVAEIDAAFGRIVEAFVAFKDEVYGLVVHPVEDGVYTLAYEVNSLVDQVLVVDGGPRVSVLVTKYDDSPVAVLTSAKMASALSHVKYDLGDERAAGRKNSTKEYRKTYSKAVRREAKKDLRFYY